MSNILNLYQKLKQITHFPISSKVKRSLMISNYTLHAEFFNQPLTELQIFLIIKDPRIQRVKIIL